MKECLKLFGIILVIFGILWPWVFGAIDLVWYFFTDNQLTLINWKVVKVIAAIVYPLIVGWFITSVFT